MIHTIEMNRILFLDIETVPLVYRYEDLDEIGKKFWDRKAEMLKRKPEETAGLMYSKAGVYAEFAKVICISVGLFRKERFVMKSFYGHDESILLEEFCTFLGRMDSNSTILCGHNGKEFDFPFLGRRILIKAMALPQLLNHHGKKPWEVKHLDTLEMWKFGDYKNYISLDLLTHVLGIPSPKGDIEGGDVARVYYEEGDLSRIEEYCRRDVVAIARIMARFKGIPIFSDDEIELIT